MLFQSSFCFPEFESEDAASSVKRIPAAAGTASELVNTPGGEQMLTAAGVASVLIGQDAAEQADHSATSQVPPLIFTGEMFVLVSYCYLKNAENYFVQIVMKKCSI